MLMQIEQHKLKTFYNLFKTFFFIHPQTKEKILDAYYMKLIRNSFATSIMHDTCGIAKYIGNILSI